MKLMVKGTVEHGLIGRRQNLVPLEHRFRNMESKLKESLEKKAKEDAKIVKARYINYKNPEGMCIKPYCKYAGDDELTFKFLHNEVYEVPMGLVEDINENGWLPERSDLLGNDGVPLVKDRKGTRIHEFVPVSFK